MHLKSLLTTKALIIITLIAISFSANAQAPNLLNYQGVARNSAGNPLPNQKMNLRLSVHDRSATGNVVYSETRVIITNLGGLFFVQVGSAGTTSATGTIGGVIWLSGDKYLQVEIAPENNNNYLNLGTVQLVSVPYAFNAVTAANALTVTTNANLTGAVTSNGNLTSLAASPALTGVPTAPTAAPGTNTTQIATTEFVKAAALTGPTGADGAQGVQGFPGADGAAGAQGIQGLPGADGAAGAQGIQGLTGSVANVGAISGTSTANGASITSGVLSLAPANATNGGIVTTGEQIFAGAKIFNADLIVNGLSVGKGARNVISNTAIGNAALFTNRTGFNNSAIGYAALFANTTGYSNTANGGSSLSSNTTGSSNTANGSLALFLNTTGGDNTANGSNALFSNTIGEGNTANGIQALQANTSGSYNTANGVNAGSTNTTGAKNTFIGNEANVASGALTNATAIGNAAIVGASNTIQLGNVSVTNVKTSGTLTAGVVTYPNTNGTNGQVLTANTNGAASWTTVSGGVTTVGSISGSSNVKGATISGTTITLSPADVTNGGIVTTGAQTFEGAKTFNADLIVNGLSVGRGAGNISTNTAIGNAALSSNTTGTNNVANGYNSLKTSTTGSSNTANGSYSLYSNTTGDGNTANGYFSLYSNTTGYQNTANGYESLKSNTTGGGNTANGFMTLQANTEGHGNTANGYVSLQANTTGWANTTNGSYTLLSNLTGYQNTSMGYNSMRSNTTGNSNTGSGFGSLQFNTTGNSNTGNGFGSLNSNTEGNYNTSLGYHAGLTNTTGNENTLIGYSADVVSNNLSNATAVGNGAKVSSSNTIQLGNTGVTNVKTSGTITAGVVTYPNTLGTANQVLTTNGVGSASWQAIASANAGTLTGTTLNSTVTGSSLTSVGTLTSATVNGKVIAGASSAASASAVLEASSTTQGFLPPRMTEAQRIAINSPVQGLMIYCTNCGANGEPEYYNGSSWVNLAGNATAAGIGSVYQGGILAYYLVLGDPGYDPTTPHGLIAASSDQSSSIIWWNGVYANPVTALAIGTGLANTNAIINSQGPTRTNYAAGIAQAYTIGSYSDWYLPSKDELNKLYLNRVAIGGFGSDIYWSSSAFNYSTTYVQNFGNGGMYNEFSNGSGIHVRAIRTF